MESDQDEFSLIGLETMFQCRLPPRKKCVAASTFSDVKCFPHVHSVFHLRFVMSVAFLPLFQLIYFHEHGDARFGFVFRFSFRSFAHRASCLTPTL